MNEISFTVTAFEQGGVDSNGEPTTSSYFVRSNMIEIPSGIQKITSVPEIWKKQWDSENESYEITQSTFSSIGNKISFYKADGETFEYLGYSSAKNEVDFMAVKCLGATHIRFTASISSYTMLHPDDSAETKKYYYFIDSINVNGTILKWYYNNDRLTHDDMLSAPEKAMKKPYPHALWRIDGISPNMPYHRLFPAKKGYNIWSLPREHVIRVYDYQEPQKGFKHNGLAILQPSECTSVHELNGRWDVTLTHPVDDWGRWKNLLPNNVLKIDGQLFRIDEHESVSDSSGVYIKVHAKHIWYDLDDKVIYVKTIDHMNGQQYMNFIFDAHFNHKDGYDEYEFQYNSDISKVVEHEELDSETIVSAFIGTNTSFLNLYGGELYRNNFYFSINERMEGAKDNAFALKYGFDMTKISQKIDYSNWVTHLILEDNYGCVYGDSWTYGVWTIHHHKTKYMRIHYDTGPDMDRLSRDGHDLWLKNAYPAVTYEINIASMKNDPKYKDFLNLQNYNLGDRGTIECRQLDIKTTQQIVSIEKNELTGDIINIKLGNLRKSLIRPSYAPNNISDGNDGVMNTMQKQLDELNFREYITRPIVTVDGKYLQASNKKFLMYKEV